MQGFMDVVTVAGFFLLRVGLPLIALMVIGTLVERAYRRREAAERPIAVQFPVKEEQEVLVEGNNES